jgi:uroporphyrinogen-III synthase
MASGQAPEPVIVLRHPERTVRIAEALADRGFPVFSLPLTDTELPSDAGVVAAELAALGRGVHRWLLVTSGTTIEALGMIARARGTTLAAAVREGGAKVGAVGPGTAGLLRDAGIAVELVPRQASSSGLLREFPTGTGSILLPQADLAPDDLRGGLEGLGWTVRRVEAYRTVAYPAAPNRRVPGVAENGNRPPVITAADVARLATDGVQPAVVFTAPSGVRAFRERLGDGPHAFVPVAIGRTTAEALRTLGWAPAATAADPTPRAIASAVQEAFSRGGSAGRAPVPPNGDQS